MKNNQIDRSGGLTSGRLSFRENWLRASVLAALLSMGTVSAYAAAFQWPADPDGIKGVTVSFDPEALTSELWKEANPDDTDDKKQHSALILLDGNTESSAAPTFVGGIQARRMTAARMSSRSKMGQTQLRVMTMRLSASTPERIRTKTSTPSTSPGISP